jgi:hypothetical protein
MLRQAATLIALAFTLTFPFLAPAAAHADAVAAPAGEVRGPAEPGNYAGQILVGDMAALALPLAAGNDRLLLGFGLVSPIVHLAHGRSDRAAISLGLHAGLPFMVAVAGGFGCAQTAAGEHKICESPLAVGAMIGALLATTIDTLMVGLGSEPPRRKTPALAPALLVGSEGRLALGIQGRL